jgi:hypothetical protein
MHFGSSATQRDAKPVEKAVKCDSRYKPRMEEKSLELIKMQGPSGVREPR